MATEWAGIVRVSFVGTRSGDSFHADSDQAEDLVREAQRQGLALKILPHELNVSGGLPLAKRPSLLAAVEGVEQGSYAGIMVSYLSRLGRNLREQLAVWDRVEAAGGQIKVIRENIDTSTAAGRMYRNLLLSIAEGEREQHAERFEERRRLATAAGIWQRRQVPLGYRKDSKTRKLVPTRDASKVVNAFERRRQGVPVTQIAQRLGMSHQGTRGLLSNRVYLGELKVGQHVNPDSHEAIVPVELFDAVQTWRPRPGRNVAKEPALLAGLVRCQACGYVMARAKTSTMVYTCRGRHGGRPCPAPTVVTAHLIDRHVLNIAAAIYDEIAPMTTSGGIALEEAHRVAAADERELAAYLAAVSAADVGADAFAEGARLRRDKAEASRTEVRRLMSLAPVAPMFSFAPESWADYSAAQRNQALRSLIECAIVSRSERGRPPIAERVRVIRFGAGVVVARRHGEIPFTPGPLPWPDLADERVAWVVRGEDAF